MSRTTSFDVLFGSLAALAAGQAAGAACGVLAVHVDAALPACAVVAGVAAGWAARAGAAGGRSLGLSVMAAVGAVSGGLIAVYLHAYGRRPEVLAALLGAHGVPESALTIATDASLQRLVALGLWQRAGWAELAWIASGALAAVCAADPEDVLMVFALSLALGTAVLFSSGPRLEERIPRGSNARGTPVSSFDQTWELLHAKRARCRS
jgi:hypothetical protein